MSTFIGATSSVNGSTMVSSLTVAKHGSLAAGHQMVAYLEFGRTTDVTSPAALVVTPPTGWALVVGTDDLDCNMRVYKKIAGGSEPADYQWSWDKAARATLVILTYSGAGDPTIAEGAGTTGNPVLTHTTPQVTADTAGRVIGAWGYPGSNPIGLDSADNTRYGAGGTHTSNNGMLLVADKVIAAGNHTMVAIANDNVSRSSLVKTIVFLPDSGANNPPTAVAGADQTVETGAPATLNGSGSSDSDGTVSTYTWRIISGAGTLSSTSGVSVTFTAPSAAGSTVIGLRVTDNNGALSAEDTLTITTVGSGQFARPNSDVTTTGWTGRLSSGLAAPNLYGCIDEVSPDNSDYVESPATPTYSQPYRFGLTPLPNPNDLTGTYFDRTLWVTAPAVYGMARLRLFNGAGTTAIATYEVAINATPTSYRFTLTTGEAGAITDYANVQAEVAFKDLA